MTAINEFELVLAIAFLISGACLVTTSIPFAPNAGVVGWSGDCPRPDVAQFNEPMRQDSHSRRQQNSSGDEIDLGMKPVPERGMRDGDCLHLASSSTERR